MDSSQATDRKTPDINQQLAARVRSLRAERGLSLEALAAATGVSRSALSLIERAESSPTAVLLDRLATGLGVTLASLFAASPAKARVEPLSRPDTQWLWQDPASGYRRRAISPAGVAAPFQIVEVWFPPGARVAYETGARASAPHQQVWLLEGTMELQVGAEHYRLEAGDCLAFALDQPTLFHNPSASPARYAVVVSDPNPGPHGYSAHSPRR